MFNENQLQKIKVFATLTKINNECFKKCVFFEVLDSKENLLKNELSLKEKKCLKTCTESFLKMRDFVENQIFEDFESVSKKNKDIFDNQS